MYQFPRAQIFGSFSGMGADETILRLFREGQRKWPLLKLEYAVFERHCSRLMAEEGEVGEVRHGSDLFLCCACANRDPRAIHAFNEECRAVANAAVIRVNRRSDFVEDVIQDVWNKLLLGAHPKILNYSGRGPLQAWVRVAATRCALDRCRTQQIAAEHQIDLGNHLASEGMSPELSLTRARYAQPFRDALRRAIDSLSHEERNVLRMHVTGQCSIDQIGRAYGVHRATAARWLERTKQRIFDMARRELSEGFARLTDSEFKSLARVMGSELELSLSAPSARASSGTGSVG
jgi:RNA polymerase sigma-70 factor, ECF subfamily